MSVAEIALKMKNVKEQLDAKKKEATELQNEFDALRKHDLPEAMEEAGIESVRVKDVGTVSLRTDAYASIKGGMKEEAYRWLTEQGYGDLIQDFVQSSTLKAFMKEQTLAGVQFPDDLFKFDPYTYVAITKR